MESPKPSPAISAVKLEHWIRLRDELAQLNAHLEYLKLMLRVSGPRRG